MNNHHCTCEECERRRQQAEDEAFATMAVIAYHHPEWFMFGDAHVHHHDDHTDHGALDDDCHDDMEGHDDMDAFDDMDDFGMWD